MFDPAHHRHGSVSTAIVLKPTNSTTLQMERCVDDKRVD
jgi:hypothetical protein